MCALERLGELAWLEVAHAPADLGHRQVARREQLRRARHPDAEHVSAEAGAANFGERPPQLAR